MEYLWRLVGIIRRIETYTCNSATYNIPFCHLHTQLLHTIISCNHYLLMSIKIIILLYYLFLLFYYLLLHKDESKITFINIGLDAQGRYTKLYFFPPWLLLQLLQQSLLLLLEQQKLLHYASLDFIFEDMKPLLCFILLPYILWKGKQNI